MADDLSALRQQWAGLESEHESFFNIKVLGGEWSVSRFRKVATDISVQAKDTYIDLWCKSAGWPPAPGQRHFSVAKCGMENARMLGEELCRRGNFFLGSWVDQGSPGGLNFQPLCGACKSPQEYTDWFEALPLSSVSAKAAFVMRNLCPLPVPEKIVSVHGLLRGVSTEVV